jgi:hypothetical protein
MLARKPTSACALFLPLLLLACARSAQAQTYDFEHDRMQVMDLTGNWRFHTGDDPRWSSPSFDDSSWTLLRPDEGWNNQSVSQSGLAWYRFRILVPGSSGSLALYIPGILTSYQVFVNGRLIGQFGGMPPHPKAMEEKRQIFPLPDDFTSSRQPLVFAIRVWSPSSSGGPDGMARFGDAKFLSHWNSLQDKETYWMGSASNYLLALQLIGGLGGLALFFLRRGDREYLWFGLYELESFVFLAWQVWHDFHPVGTNTFRVVLVLLGLLGFLIQLNFIVALVRDRKGWLYWCVTVSLALESLLCVPGALAWISVSAWNASLQIGSLPLEIAMFLILYRGTKRGIRDAWLLLIPFGLSYSASWLHFLLQIDSAHIPPALLHQLDTERVLSDWPFPFAVQTIVDFIIEASLLAILVFRFARTRRDERRLAAELESARAVQHVLIPHEVPSIPGFHIQCVYKPAGEVGGDFFQILALPGGSVLLAIGDVSGKGMPAAMTVSLLVGTLRTLAHYTENPAAVLAAMNQRMIGRTAGGFTTCLVLRADPDGAIIAANAGHLAPYVQGRELPVENGLPLGLATASTYSETAFRLAEDEQLTLLTDGVVEARAKTGELLGFERTAAITLRSAEEIAVTAQQFGQNDDITVVTLIRQPVPAPPARLSAAAPALSPA